MSWLSFVQVTVWDFTPQKRCEQLSKETLQMLVATLNNHNSKSKSKQHQNYKVYT